MAHVNYLRSSGPFLAKFFDRKWIQGHFKLRIITTLPSAVYSRYGDTQRLVKINEVL